MTGLKKLVGIALIVGGTTAVVVGQDQSTKPRGGGWEDKDRGDRGKKKGDDTDTSTTRPRGAPEIDGTSAVGGLALLSGLLLVFRGDRRV